MPTSYLRAALLDCCLFWAGSEPTFAQLQHGGIAGTVSDPSGAVVANAQVTARSVATGLERSAETDEWGSFLFAVLPPGVYELRVSAEGFQDPRKRVVVQTGATTRADIQLTVDILEQVVEALDVLPDQPFRRSQARPPRSPREPR